MYRRLLLLVLAPSLGLLLAVAVVARGARTEANQATAVAHLAELGARGAALDTALGLETVAAANELDSNSLIGSFTRTDISLSRLQEHAATSTTSNGRIDAAIEQIVETLRYRDDIDSGVVSPLQLADRYASARASLGKAIAAEAVLASPDRRTREVSSLLALVNASSAHVDERLAVGLAIRYDTWAPGQLALVVGALERQELHLHEATKSTPTLDLTAEPELDLIRSGLLTSNELPPVNMATWNELSDEWSRHLSATIGQHADFVAATARDESQRASRAFELTLFGGGFIVLAAIGSAFMVSVRLARRLGRISDATRRLASDPGRSITIDDHVPDDLGAVARAFNSMADQVRTASNRQRLEAAALEAIVRERPIVEVVDSCNELVHPLGVFEPMRDEDGLHGDVVFRDAHGHIRSIDTAVRGARPEVRLAVDLLRIATRRERDLGDLEHRANFDALTGLPNRARSIRQLEALCTERSEERGSAPPAILFMDLDGFKAINDEHGHDRGDEVLRNVASQARGVAEAAGATLGRLGGDEFVVVVPAVRNERELFVLAASLRDRILNVATPRGRSLDVSTGIAVRQPGQSHLQMLSDADDAMYSAKGSPRRAVLANDDLRGSRQAQQERERLLMRTLVERDLEAHYQPIWDIAGTQVIAMEALARPGGGFGAEGPAPFFAAAERLGLAADFDQLMIRIAADQLGYWNSKGLDVVPIAVNLSAQSLSRSTLVEEIRDILHLTECPPELLILEVTEEGLIRDLVETASHLERLRELGIRIAIDDFGTGYSSLAYLAQLPFDILKLDRQLVADIDTNDTNRSIVETVIRLAEILEVSVVAEGVERAEERTHLAAIGCHHVQGFLLARPEPANEAVERLTRKARVRL